ncbi:MAG TPA: glycine C-acetyltransferase [Thermoanaerobaculia bacterium]|nr:glycine C-acetyltransferase [Thermoanaerobaculia bacterium]
MRDAAVATLLDHLAAEMAKLRQAGTYKEELVLESPQDARVRVAGSDVVMLTSNNYLGFANHPRVREAQKKAIDRWGAGMASVRFICGTEELHKELEAEIAGFFGTDDSILYMSCWNANEGLFAAILDENDGLYSDELNHASIIDGVRLCKAKRFRVPHDDMAAFERLLAEDTTSRYRLMITDGVFSMEGEEANLRELVRICEEKDVLLAVDDSHATGVLGATGRGTAEEQGVFDRIPVTTGTLGKAMGSAAGGFVAGPRPLVETLRQRSRTYLFSNSLPPAVAAGSLEAFRMLREDPSPVRKLRENAAYFRKAISDAGFRIPHGTHPIVPVIVGDTAKALAMGKALFEEGVYVSGFGYPVVPQGQARLRCQVSAAHERADLDRAVDAFRKVGRKFGVIE